MRSLKAAVIAGALLLASAASWASSLSVAPVRVQLSDKKPGARIDVVNLGSAPVVVQLDLQSWTQTGDRDEYRPSTDLVFNPPLFRLEPGKAQVIRVGFRQVPNTSDELSYRLFLTELGKPSGGGPGLNVNVRLGVPIFFQRGASDEPLRDRLAMGSGAAAAASAATLEPPSLHWSAQALDDRKISLKLRNDGSRHARLRSAELLDADTQQVIGKVGLSYCLPGCDRQWEFEHTSPSSGRWILRADIDGQTTSTEILGRAR